MAPTLDQSRHTFAHGRARRLGRAAFSAALSLAATLATGCVVGPNYRRPAAPVPLVYKELPPPPLPNGSWKTAAPADATLRGDWWTLYNDPQLTALEGRLTLGNQTLQAAIERYANARAVVRQAHADYYPTLAAGPTIQRERLSYNRPTYISNLSPSQYNDYVVSGQASWEPDFWGRVRRNVETARANMQASAADLANVELSVRAELALDYFELRGLDAQQQLLDATVVSYKAFLDLTNRRAKGGVATQADVLLAETQLATTQTQDIDVAVARAQYQHAIATLIGVPASSFALPPLPQTTDIPPIPAGVPSTLLERRPDISTAERQAQAANAQIGVALAAYYPNISITGAGGFESGQPGTWIQGPSELWSLGASASETLFDAGRRRSITDEARANYRQSVANYRQAVLNGFQEVEDNLAALRVLEQESGSAATALNAANRSLALSTNRYKGGVTTYLEVLTSQQAQLADQRTQADITTRQFAASVQLIRALGGGWDTSKLPPM
jgi:NodT family efflux transporter outer membrane factor (OMF) lipoprotein